MGKEGFFNICMVSDFFFPNMGGVESHIYLLSQCLIRLGHKVVVVTHAYDDRIGVRYMTQGLKVYYLPIKPMYNQCILPTVFSTLPLIRDIALREQIDIIHGHSAFSTLAHESMLHAATMDLRTVFTDHSLFGFADLSSILTNKVLKVSLHGISHVICVSHTSKENTVLRSNIDPYKVSVIPNAVDATKFTPDPSKRRPGRITVVIVSRLVLRKGSDLMAAVIPYVCGKYSHVDFLIAGDGPRRISIEEVREKYRLDERVEMLGSISHDKVRGVLNCGDIFLNTSLTEAFCIAIVEAACCGLKVVSTRVGGIPEVLPPDLIELAEPRAADLQHALEKAIKEAKYRSTDSFYKSHESVRKLYTWQNVAERTDVVYRKVMKQKTMNFNQRITEYLKTGFIFGKVFILIAALNYILFLFCAWIRPARDIGHCSTLHKYFQVPGFVSIKRAKRKNTTLSKK